MQRKKMIWREISNQDGPYAKHLYLGDICVAVVLASPTNRGWYCYSLLLPINGIKNWRSANELPTEADCMHSVQTAVDKWFKLVMEA